MKFLFGSTLQKVLAAIVAAVMSFSIITPAIKPQAKKTHTPGIVRQVRQEGDKIVGIEPVIVPTEEDEDEDIVAPAEYAGDEDRTDDPAPAPEAENEAANHEDRENRETPTPAENPAPAENEAPAEEETAAPAEAIAEWDVSATEDDNVQMYYFADDSFLGAIRNLFAPMVALADEEEANEPETPAEDPLVTENGVTHRGGTIYITGNGSTQKALFMDLINDYAEFVNAYETWVEEEGFDPGEMYVLKANLDEDGCIKDGEDTVTGEVARQNYYNQDGTVDYERMLHDYFPFLFADMVTRVDNFWDEYARFIPTKVVFDGEIDTIGFAAFAFFPSITEVEFLGTVKHIEGGAFACTNITTITFNEGLESLSGFVFAECYRLHYVYLPNGLRKIGEEVFTGIRPGSRIHCANANVVLLLVCEDDLDTASYDEEGNPVEKAVNYNPARTTLSWD